MKRVDGLDLWVYTPQASSIMRGRSQRIQLYNVWVIYGCQRYFHNISSPWAFKLSVAKRVEGEARVEAWTRAENLVANFDKFLWLFIGTSRKQSRPYKDFMEEVDELKVKIMKRRMLET